MKTCVRNARSQLLRNNSCSPQRTYLVNQVNTIKKDHTSRHTKNRDGYVGLLTTAMLTLRKEKQQTESDKNGVDFILEIEKI